MESWTEVEQVEQMELFAHDRPLDIPLFTRLEVTGVYDEAIESQIDNKELEDINE